MSLHLLDANVVIAIADEGHEHHGAVSSWFTAVDEVALCPFTEGALARYLLRTGESGSASAALLNALALHPRFRFLPDSITYRDVDLAAVRGHRQVTDAYLVALARHHDGVLATLDSALSRMWPEHTALIDPGA